MRLFSFLVSISLCAAIKNVPRAPGLANSNWPVAHADTWNSDVSDNKGPTSSVNATSFLLINGDTVKDLLDIFALADPITLVQSHIEGFTWGSSISSVFQLQTNSSGIFMVNSFYRDFNFEYHGAYSLLGADGTYYAAARTSLQAYNNEVPLDFSTSILKTNEYFVSGLDDDEHIVGLTLTHDQAPFLVFATTKGKVGAVSVDFKTIVPFYQITGIETVEMPSHFVSNSIAMDGPDGGIYVVTSSSLNRLKWDSASKTISNGWSTTYGEGNDPWYYGRLGPGAGTSPTISGPSGTPEYVVITDGENPMNIRYFNAKTGAEAGKHIVLFGCNNAKLACNSTTDQSIVVSGYKAVVVNNYVATEVTPFCSEWFASLPVSQALKMECPYIFGEFVNGIEQFAIDPATNVVSSVWANDKVSCTSSIPVLSEPNGILYCLGKRERVGRRAVYTIEAVDWNNGKSLFHVELATVLLANSLYAATEIGSNGDIVMGTLSGIVRVSELSASNSGLTIEQTMHQLMSAVDKKGEKEGEGEGEGKGVAAWQALHELYQLYESGVLPTKEFLSSIGL